MNRIRRNESGEASETLTFVGVVLGGLVVLAVLVVCLIWTVTFWKNFGREQSLKNARNRVKVSQIEIQNQAQRVQIAKQKADIRLENAIGVREAQDEIAKTLTPLYVQFEMVDALKAIAASGKNNSVVYLPAGANGVPLVATVNPNQVTKPDGDK